MSGRQFLLVRHPADNASLSALSPTILAARLTQAARLQWGMSLPAGLAQQMAESAWSWHSVAVESDGWDDLALTPLTPLEVLERSEYA